MIDLINEKGEILMSFKNPDRLKKNKKPVYITKLQAANRKSSKKPKK